MSVSMLSQPTSSMSMPELLATAPPADRNATSLDLVYSSLLGGAINVALPRCAEVIAPFANDEREVDNIRNNGLIELKIEMDKAGHHVDKSFKVALQSLMAIRYIDMFLSSRSQILDADDAFCAFVAAWLEEVTAVGTGFDDMSTMLTETLTNVSSFRTMHPSGSAEVDPCDMPQIQILKLVKADMSRVYMPGTAPPIHASIEGAISRIGILCGDVADLAQWWRRLETGLQVWAPTRTGQSIVSLKLALPKLHNFVTPYVSEMQQVVKTYSGKSFNYPTSKGMIESAKYSFWCAPSPRSLVLVPVWKNLLSTTSFTLISTPVSIDCRGHRLTYLVSARIMQIDEVEDNMYGIILRLTTGDISGVKSELVHGNEGGGVEAGAGDAADAGDGSRSQKAYISKLKYRCSSMRVEWTFDQTKDAEDNPGVVIFEPSLSNCHTTETKKSKKATAKSPSSIVGVPIPSVTGQIGAEMTIPYYASAHGLPLFAGSLWTITENEVLERGVLACDLGVILIPKSGVADLTSMALKITLKFDTRWKGTIKRGGKMLLTRKHRSNIQSEVKGSTSIPLCLYRSLGLIGCSDVGRHKYLDGCGLISGDKKDKK